MVSYSMSRSSLTMNSIWKERGRRPTLRRTCKVFIPRDLRDLDTLRLPATYEHDHYLVQKLKTFTKHKLHHVILVAVISIYIYAGALLFQYLNSECGSTASNGTEQRDHLMLKLHDLSRRGMDYEWKEAWKELIEKHENLILKNASEIKPRKALSIESCIFFCFTVITTIGYGNIAPCTDLSRAFTIFYASLGVPLMILVLADLGKLFTKAIKFVFFYVRRFYRTGSLNQHKTSVTADSKPLQYMTVSWRSVKQNNGEQNGTKQPDLPKFQHNKVTTLTIHNDEMYKNLDFFNPDEKNHKHIEVKDNFKLPITLAAALVVIYMIVGGFLFALWENWTFFEGFYFVFVSMTTLGFGDYVPENENCIMGAFAYLVLGLVLSSMCINVIREKLTVTFQKARVRIGDNTVLNIGALLQDEDHRSRAPHIDNNCNNCYGFKMTYRRESVPAATNNLPQIKISEPVMNMNFHKSRDDLEIKSSENLLRIPSQNRFTFYDSPYNTIQDDACENRDTVNKSTLTDDETGIFHEMKIDKQELSDLNGNTTVQRVHLVM